MCYYNGIRVTHGEFLRLKQLEKLVTTSINIPVFEGPLYAPDARYPVLKPIEGKEDFEIVNMEWGFLPSPKKWPFIRTREEAVKWRRGFVDEKGKYRQMTTLNATAENLFVNEQGTESMFAEAAMGGRVLVPSSGFFEWRHIPQIGKKGQELKAKLKIPYYVYLPEHLELGKPFYMLGTHRRWIDMLTGEIFDTFAIPTTDANFLMRQVHNSKNRMPSMPPTEDIAYEWMFGKLSRERVTEIAKMQYPAEKMWAHTVAKDFKTSMDPTAPFDYGDLVTPLKRAA